MRLAWVLLLAGCGAFGGSGWSQPKRLTGPFALPRGEASDWGPRLHAGPAGGALLVWAEEILATSGWVVKAARWGGLGWSAAAPVGGGDGPLPLSGRPVAALDHEGNAFVAWSDGQRVSVARQRPGRPWEEPLRLGGKGEGKTTLPALGASPDGRVLLVWGWAAADESAVVGRWHHPVRGWEEAERLASPTEPARAPAVAFSPTGTTVVAWVAADPRRDHLQLVLQAPPSGWGPVVDVPSATEPPDPYAEACCWSYHGLVLNLPAPSDLRLVWEGRYRGAVGVVVPSLWSARLGPAAKGEGALWQVERLDPAPQGRHLRALSPPGLALAPDGTAVVLWAEAAAPTNAGVAPAEVWGRHQPALGPWEPAARVATLAEMAADGPLGARVAVAAPRADEALALWAREEPNGWLLSSSTWRPGVGWRPAEHLAGPVGDRLAAPALAPVGESLLAAWLTGSDEAGWRLVAARRRRR